MGNIKETIATKVQENPIATVVTGAVFATVAYNYGEKNGVKKGKKKAEKKYAQAIADLQAKVNAIEANKTSEQPADKDKKDQKPSKKTED